MLVLSRKEGETLKIGDNVELTVTRIRGNRVQLAIAAPRSVRVVRGELAPLPAAGPAPASPAAVRPACVSACQISASVVPEQTPIER